MTKSAAHTRTRRYKELRAMLEKRYRELSSQIKGSIRDGRTQDVNADVKGTLINDSSEVPGGTVEGEIDLALTQLRAETLQRVAAALSRLEEGHYGRCAECEGEIPEARLKAMPFAIRCLECESAKEEAARVKSAASRDRLLRALS
jgi:RNA polymerase-binding transcription factor